MEKRNSYLKYIAIALVAVFLVASALLVLEVWEGRQHKFPTSDTEYGVVTYEGKEYAKRDGVESFLLLGLDKFEGQTTADSHESGVQTDFLMLFVIDNDKKQYTAIHIDRDTMTKVNKLAIGGTTVVESFTKQIAVAYNYVNDDNDKIRCRNTKDSVEHLLKGVKVDHYLSLTMDAVPAISDLVEGVEVTVLDDFTGIDDGLIKGEKVNLTGERALRYVRSRQGLEDSSNSARMARQQQFIEALQGKLASKIATDEEFVVNLAEIMDDYVVYDSSNSKMQKIAEKFDEYEFLGTRKIDGEAKMGEEFMEFHPDEASLWETVLELFYKEKPVVTK